VESVAVIRTPLDDATVPHLILIQGGGQMREAPGAHNGMRDAQ